MGRTGAARRTGLCAASALALIYGAPTLAWAAEMGA